MTQDRKSPAEDRYSEEVAGEPDECMHVSELIYHGLPSYRISSLRATYFIQQANGGMASLVDLEGKDWISYRPYGGSNGEFRGIPNLKYPEDYFHPGKVNASSKIIQAEPHRCCIHIRTFDGVGEAIWEIHPQYAVFNLLKGPKAYWFLYEGTPAGQLDEKDGYIVRSDGLHLPASEPWEAVINPGWLYFGSGQSSKVLFLAQKHFEACPSSYWPMESNMTVFGFGRKGMDHFLEKIPAAYVVGLVNAGRFDYVKFQIEEVLASYVVG